MTNLKKWAGAGGALALILCWPLAVGQIGQSVVEKELNNRELALVDVTVESYDRGYLSSTVMTRLTVRDAALQAQLKAEGLPDSYLVHSTLSHGLASISAKSTLANVTWPLTLNTTTQLNGDTEFDFQLAAIRQSELKPGLTVSVDASSFTGNVAIDGLMQFALTVPSVRVTNPEGAHLTLTQVQGTGEGRNNGGYWLGTQSLKLKRVAFEEPQAVTITSDDIVITSDTQLNENGSRITSDTRAVLGALQLPDEPTVNDLTFGFSMSQLDVTAFNGIVDALQHQNEADALEPAVVLGHLDTLFNKGFAVAIDEFSMRIDDGTMNASVHWQVPEGTTGLKQNPMQLLAKTNGEMKSYVSQTLVEKYPNLQQGVDELIISEMAEEVQGGYQMNTQLLNGNIQFANGEQVPLFNLLMPIFM
ncbi:YdgA family protein [Vibrio sp. SM6]|uniref:YdgA family protein n=1 Tax=Vibrio agarilyticus TaxID=2726741 RepID=A0A7X8TMM5_9VIBR|nr:DUF945 family protein [Vibrio agarilyticus]NLS11370.1 YdgA family protein [Vibrio agarilyticus]